MLAGLSRGGNTNDLTGTTLEDQQIADADVMAGDCNGVSHSAATLNVANSLMDPVPNTTGTPLSIFLLDDHLLTLVLWMKRMKDAVRGIFKTATEGVVAPFVVVVTHAWTMC